MVFPSVAFVLLSTVAVGTFGAPLSSMRNRDVPSSHVLHERHERHWSRQWIKRDKVPDTAVLPMRIGLKQQNLKAGHDRLMDISNPKSVNFGQHMSPEEVIDFFAPPQPAVDAIVAWLVESGISAERVGQSANKQWIQFDATVAEAEDLLFAEYYTWEHTSSGIVDLSADEYHIPRHIRRHIDYVTPGTRLRTRKTKRGNDDLLKKRNGRDGIARPFITKLPSFPNPSSTTCDTFVTAECTRAQYSIPNATTAAPGNELGIFESIDDHYSRAELDVYFSTLYPHIPNGTYPEERLVDGAVGAVEDPSPVGPVPVGLESSLDFDSAWPLIYPQGTVLYQVDDEYYEATNEGNGFWNTFLDAIDGSYCTYSAYGETGDCIVPECMDPVYPDPNPGGYTGQLQCGVYEPTNVISISYGEPEAALPDYYIKRQCNEWMKLALQGTTVVISSGDSGVGIDPTEPCLGPRGDIFSPDTAASCPYVLSVGSTEWNRFSNATAPKPYETLNEIATRRFASGGGFSNVHPQPDYQSEAVSTYLSSVSLPFTGYTQQVTDADFSDVTSGVFHSTGRGYPDVAAVGDRQLVFGNGSWYLIGGTSLSAPVWGAVLTLVNEDRILAGKGPVGFIHPILYQHPEAFNDVTVGNNPGCNTTGFPAAEGWDPVTGLGSPNFPVLLDVLKTV